MSQLILIRDYDSKTDRGFCGNAWINGLKYGNILFRQIPDHVMLDWYGHIIDDLIDHAKIKVACLQDDPTVNIGFSCFETPMEETCSLHWIYVKAMWQKNGVAKMLLPKDIKVVTHLTRLGQTLKSKLGREVQYVPYTI